MSMNFAAFLTVDMIVSVFISNFKQRGIKRIIDKLNKDLGFLSCFSKLLILPDHPTQ